MLWAIAIILLLLWAIGLITSTTMGGFIHVLVVAAVVLLLVRIIRGSNRKGNRRENDRRESEQRKRSYE
jgi:uncharacterized protein (DUF58 family)